MKVLFIARATLYTDRGGDTVQILETAKELRRLDVEVDVRLTNEDIQYSTYELIHFFNLIRPADMLKHISRSAKPFVVSTIFVDYSEYERRGRKGLTGMLFRFFSSDQIEYLKVLARWVLKGERVVSPVYLFWGQRRSVRYIMKHAARLLPNSQNEYRRLELSYKLSPRYAVITNGIDPEIFVAGPETLERNNNVVLCVGRIEGRKNQLNLIRAVAGTDFELIIVGSAAVNQKKYYEACIQAAAGNVRFIPAVQQEELLKFYRSAKVHVLASWFETTGLSSLEAAIMGCNVVITDKGDAREYFGSDAWYCDPDSPASIRNAILEAAANKPNEDLIQKIITCYNWKRAAVETKGEYLAILRNATQ